MTEGTGGRENKGFACSGRSSIPITTTEPAAHGRCSSSSPTSIPAPFEECCERFLLKLESIGGQRIANIICLVIVADLGN
jgi:hypothetical protein